MLHYQWKFVIVNPVPHLPRTLHTHWIDLIQTINEGFIVHYNPNHWATISFSPQNILVNADSLVLHLQCMLVLHTCSLATNIYKPRPE